MINGHPDYSVPLIECKLKLSTAASTRDHVKILSIEESSKLRRSTSPGGDPDERSILGENSMLWLPGDILLIGMPVNFLVGQRYDKLLRDLNFEFHIDILYANNGGGLSSQTTTILVFRRLRVVTTAAATTTTRFPRTNAGGTISQLVSRRELNGRRAAPNSRTPDLYDALLQLCAKQSPIEGLKISNECPLRRLFPSRHTTRTELGLQVSPTGLVAMLAGASTHPFTLSLSDLRLTLDQWRAIAFHCPDLIQLTLTSGPVCPTPCEQK